MESRLTGTLFAITTTMVLMAMPTTGICAEKSAPITISTSDFLLSPKDILKRVGRLESMAHASVSTAEYARQYTELQDDLSKAKPKVSDWNAADKKRLQSLPEPTDTAWKALNAEKSRKREEARNRAEQTRRENETAARQARDQQQARKIADRREQEAAERQARIDKLEAQTDYYDDANYNGGGYYNPWWWHHGNNHHGQWHPNQQRREGVKPWKPGPVLPFMGPLSK